MCALCYLIVGECNRWIWVGLSENNRPKTKNYTTRCEKIIQKVEFTPPPPPPPLQIGYKEYFKDFYCLSLKIFF